MANKNKKNKKARVSKNKKQKERKMEDVIDRPIKTKKYESNDHIYDGKGIEHDLYIEDINEDNINEDVTTESYDMIRKTKEECDIEGVLQLLNDEEIIIDRDQEDADVTEFQKTGDMDLLERIYKDRIPTLQSWANKHFYPGLTSSVEDLFEDLSVVFVKAAQKYNKSRGAFNTCLFTFLDNRLKNIKNSKYAKKRISDEYTGPLNGMVLSLDFPYNDGDGSDLTLKDVIPGKVDLEESTDFRDSLTFLAKGNPVVREFFKKISDGNSLASLLKEYKIRSGSIDLSDKKQELNKLKSRKNKKLVTEIIKSYGVINGEFKLVEYELYGKDNTRLQFKVEMKKTKETDIIVKAIRDLKKHKGFYVSKIRGG